MKKSSNKFLNILVVIIILFYVYVSFLATAHFLPNFLLQYEYFSLLEELSIQFYIIDYDAAILSSLLGFYILFIISDEEVSWFLNRPLSFKRFLSMMKNIIGIFLVVFVLALVVHTVVYIFFKLVENI
ncbi:hypothetical protein WAF17_01990 [Bernardetia sp. ABR2-2B]|uniref:hypothetical protein n=1 Tax=Bernardetia sp. ABR2-2B TaxID=3127472 RepID=UPI0030D33EB2